MIFMGLCAQRKNANVNQFAVEKLKTKLRHWYAHKICIIWLKLKKIILFI